MQNVNTVGQAQRFDRIMGDENDGPPGEKRSGHVLQAHAGQGIDGGERFIHQDNGFVLDQGAGEGGTLAHAA